jgi:hypothetical protein
MGSELSTEPHLNRSLLSICADKQDRMFQLAKRFRMPLVIYTEGGGGRPGDTDGPGGVGMDSMTFTVSILA